MILFYFVINNNKINKIIIIIKIYSIIYIIYYFNLIYSDKSINNCLFL